MLQYLLKNEVISYLDELSHEAEETRSVNTIYLKIKLLATIQILTGFHQPYKIQNLMLMEKDFYNWCRRSSTIYYFFSYENECIKYYDNQ